MTTILILILMLMVLRLVTQDALGTMEQRALVKSEAMIVPARAIGYPCLLKWLSQSSTVKVETEVETRQTEAHKTSTSALCLVAEAAFTQGRLPFVLLAVTEEC